MSHLDDSRADDLQPVIDLLHAHRPEATALELDSVHQRVRRRVAGAPAGRRARSANLMKSRMAILSMLVAGMVLSTSGAGLALSNLSGTNDASVAQYGTPTPTPTQTGATLGETNQNTPTVTNQGANNGPSGGSSPSGGTNTVVHPSPTQPAVQPTRQVEAGAGSQLPFTGFLAIPVLLGGIALLTAGIVLRRRMGDDR